MLNIDNGLINNTIITLNDIAVKASYLYPNFVVNMWIVIIEKARKQDAVKPHIATYKNSMGVIIKIAYLFLTLNNFSINDIAVYKKPICKPETANICAIPTFL